MKLNNKGFTLVELLGVIVLLAIVITIAVPSIQGITKKVKQNMLETKMKLILEEAKMYGQDHMADIIEDQKTLGGCVIIDVSYLVNAGYLAADEEGEGVSGKYIVNPAKSGEYLDRKTIFIKVKNRRIVAAFADSDLDGEVDINCNNL